MLATQLQSYLPIVYDKDNPLHCPFTFIKMPPTIHKKENPALQIALFLLEFFNRETFKDMLSEICSES